MTSPNPTPRPAAQNGLREEDYQSVRDALAGLRFGLVTITVHEGRLVQIDRTEKQRLAAR